MTEERDLAHEMKRSAILDVRTADLLLSGLVAPLDAPPGYASIAEVVHCVAASPRPNDPVREAATIAAVVRELRSNNHLRRPVRTRSVRGRVLGAKAAVLAGTMVFGATAAAAATNTLPAPVQRAVSEVVAHVGVSIPEPHAHGNRHSHGSAARSGSPGTAVGPDATASARYGLCTAYDKAPAAAKSVALANVRKAADAAGTSVTDFCKSAVSPSGKGDTPTTAPRGSTPTTPTRGSGPPSSTPGDTAPGKTTPGDTAPGKSTDKTTPRDTAPGRSTDKTTPGDTAPGHSTDKSTPGDTAPGHSTDKSTPGDTAPGKLEHKP
jgi:hypothetical protein